MILAVSYGTPCFADETGKTERSSPALTQESGEGQPRATNQRRKEIHQLDRMIDQRDWDHRKPGRDWRMRGNDKDLGH
jgi:hypothetical protein